ncbi:hypothetical protein TVAG_495510 [Trichomonas vaginalis G3]|uniref:Thioredoxin domain-containing protein n=1 Tax=Trichomonas vaginalis (strain ATCC PRA-98 / G3) TaxID=412133 RepID=A2DVJ4_TRIV3|nr:protein disulfide isomerase family [Trichomonas vaginalis G3]EAY15536.1 hypothetical protein TVAG_495510 [Trichomonas vaginalis G3]KAI5526182.1 protein disulfide isomerase family [Trichomonas vaginalis G3]|eukprot:XP_001327759.1 hypothetical protein [Trichomonas vaginalis G3]
MIWALLALSQCFYVPYSETGVLIYDSYTDRQFGSVLKRHQLVVSLFVNFSAPGVEAYLEIFSKLPTIFSEDVKFCVLSSKHAKRLTMQFTTYLPQISFFNHGEIAYSIPFPSTEAELLSAVDVFLRPTLPTFNDEKEVYASFGETQFTVISPPALVQKARDYVISIADNAGSFNLIAASVDTFKKMNFSGEYVCIYRKEDKMIKEVKNFREFMKQIRPTYYPKFDMDLLLSVEGPVGLLCVKDSPTKEQKERMAELGSKFQNLTFAIISDADLDDIHIMTNGKTRQFPCFVILSWEYYVYYPVRPFDNEVENYIMDISNGKIDYVFPSEEIPATQEDPYAIKVVGKNYEEFVTDKENDVVMFYIGSDKDGLRAAHKIGKYIKKNNVTGVKVGYIITSLNSCNKSFPRLVFEPQVNIFAKGKKSSHMLYSAPTVFSILEGLKMYANPDINLNISTFRFSMELEYMVDLLQDFEELRASDRKGALAYIYERGQMLGFGNNLETIVNSIYNAAGGLVAGYDDKKLVAEFENDADDFVEPEVEEELTRQSYTKSSHRGSGRRSHHHRRY